MSVSYPRIDRPKNGAAALAAPGFPFECPICKAKRVALIGSKTEERQAKYACGGFYVPATPNTVRTNSWEGSCGLPKVHGVAS